MMFRPLHRAVLLAFALVSSACTIDQESNRYTEALEIPLNDDSDRRALVDILYSATRAHEDMHVDDVSERYAAYHNEVEVLDASDRPTISISVWIGENDDDLVASIDDLGHRDRVWATFLKGEDVEQHRQFRLKAVEAIRKQWPETRSIPILPSGGIGNPADFVIIDGDYRIDRAQAQTYDLPSDSQLLADRSTN